MNEQNPQTELETSAQPTPDAALGYEVHDGLPRCVAACSLRAGETCAITGRPHGRVCEPAVLRALSAAKIGFSAGCGPVDAGNGTCG